MVGGVREIPMNSSSNTPPTGACGDGGTPSRSRSANATASTLRSEKGQAAVEFALVVPVFCLIVLALIDFGKALNYWLDTSHLAAEGARLAAVLGNSPEPGGDWKSWIQQQAESTELRDGTGSVTSKATVTVCLPNGTPAKIGDPVKVTVSADYKWIPFVGGATITLASSSTMRLERLPTYTVSGC
jgi:Flp pilus assembly protein TadG